MYLYAREGLGQLPTATIWSCQTSPWVILDDFVVGDYRIRPSHYEKLLNIRDSVKQLLNLGLPISVSIEGFTDSSGKERMNTGLSASRAMEVQTFLVRLGVPVHNVVGRGESSPPAPNTSEAGRRKNRRVELRLCQKLPLQQTPQGPGVSI
jgi:outer membrane protein OmpA-like peptidoglycan-associated protein